MRLLSILILALFSFSSFAQSLYEQAEKAFHAGQHEQSLKLLNEKIEKEPDATDYLLRALVFESQGLFSNANDDFVAAIKLDEEYHEAYFHFAEFLLNTEENEKAMACLSFLLNKIQRSETKGVFFKVDQHGLESTKVSSLSSMEPEILMNRGLAYQKMNMLTEALADMNTALEHERSAGYLINRALLHVSMENLNDAKKDLKEATNVSPQNSLAWYNLFVLDKSSSIPDGLLQASEFGPLLAARAVESFDEESYSEAERFFNKALELMPDDVPTLLNAGRLDYKLGNFQRAEQRFEKALKLDPSRKEALYLLGNAKFGQGLHEDALKMYSSYLMSDPTNSSVWFNAGMSYLELNDSENGCQCLTRASQFGMNKADQFLAQYCTKE